MSTKLLTPFTASSNGVVMNLSMSSAVLPGLIVLINTSLVTISGKSSLGNSLYAFIPSARKINIKKYIMFDFPIAQTEGLNSLSTLFIS